MTPEQTSMDRWKIFFAPLLLALLAGCDGETRNPESLKHQPTSLSTPDTIKVLKEVEQIRRQHGMLTLDRLNVFKGAMARFLDHPNDESLNALRHGWQETHQAFIQWIFFSLSDQSRLRYQVDAWPIQAGFLDSIPGYPASGIINDQTLRIDAETLAHQHGITDTQEVSLGFHPLEFLIFDRKVADFEVDVHVSAESEGITVEAVPESVPEKESLNVRRRQMLTLIFNMMDRDIRTGLQEENKLNSELIADIKNSDKPAHEGIKLTIERLVVSVQLLFAEVNYIDSEKSGHSRFSDSSWADLGNQVAVLNEISGPDSGLAPILIQLDHKLAQDYATTLSQTVDIFTQDQPQTENLPRILLLFAALGHQLEDMNKILVNDLR